MTRLHPTLCASLLAATACSHFKSPIAAPPPPPEHLLSVQVVDEARREVPLVALRLEKGACADMLSASGWVDTDEHGRATFRVCPDKSGEILLAVVPDFRTFRVPPIQAFEIHDDMEKTVGVISHEAALQAEALGGTDPGGIAQP